MLRLIIILFFFAKVCHSQEWTDIHLSGSGNRQVWATSELPHPDDDQEDYFAFDKRYGAFNLFDKDLATAWVEGEDDSGIGVSLFLRIPENLRRIDIFNGYGKSRSLYEKNNRVKAFKIAVYTGVHPDGYLSENGLGYLAKKYSREYPLHVKDSFGMQSLEFPFSWDELYAFRDSVIASYPTDHDVPMVEAAFIIQLEIADIYKGSSWDDTCISEMELYASYLPGEAYPDILNVYTGETNESKLYVDTSFEKSVLLIDDPGSVFQIMEHTSDNQWVSIIKMPANLDESRVETEWLIVNAFLGKIMNSEIEKKERIELTGPFYLIEREGITLLEYAGGEIILN